MFDSIEQIPGGSERMYNAPLSRIGTAYPLISLAIRYKLNPKTGLFYDAPQNIGNLVPLTLLRSAAAARGFRRRHLGQTLAVARHAGPIAMLHLIFETISSSTNPLAMFRFANVRLPTKAVRAPSRRLLTVSTGLLCLGLLTGCPQTPPTSPIPVSAQAKDNELHFDKRYLDSLDGPQSARTQREMAIYQQLGRLESLKEDEKASTNGHRIDTTGKSNPDEPTFERLGGGRLVRYRNWNAWRADVYRKIDSLKVLEHIPLTPH